MPKSKVILYFISLLAIVGGAGLTVYITTLNKTLNKTQTQLTESQNLVASLEGDIGEKETLIVEKTKSLKENEEALERTNKSLASKKEELESQGEQLQAKQTELDRKTREAENLLSRTEELKDNMETVSECFGGVMIAVLSEDPIIAFSAISEVEDECEVSAEILETL